VPRFQLRNPKGTVRWLEESSGALGASLGPLADPWLSLRPPCGKRRQGGTGLCIYQEVFRSGPWSVEVENISRADHNFTLKASEVDGGCWSMHRAPSRDGLSHQRGGKQTMPGEAQTPREHQALCTAMVSASTQAILAATRRAQACSALHRVLLVQLRWNRSGEGGSDIIAYLGMWSSTSTGHQPKISQVFTELLKCTHLPVMSPVGKRDGCSHTWILGNPGLTLGWMGSAWSFSPARHPRHKMLRALVSLYKKVN